ncbi:MAG TPA: hypothetical protein PLA68_05920 [Panacibacter sp.]|nr:hypothetical protein [Panacibacter sp.]
MRVRRIFFTAAILCSLLSCNAQNSKVAGTKINELEQALQQHPKDQQSWQQLYILINENYTKLTAAERARLRGLLQQYAVWSSGTLYTAGEPGTKIMIKGRIINKKGTPVANAALHIFQTDSHGYYTPLDSIEKKMGEPDARLFCFLKTDNNGFFEINTIRPASYPIQYKGKIIPQHIHLNITAGGYANRNLQMVFDDDPVMDDYWRQWATQNQYPMLILNNATPQRVATIEIMLVQ